MNEITRTYRHRTKCNNKDCTNETPIFVSDHGFDTCLSCGIVQNISFVNSSKNGNIKFVKTQTGIFNQYDNYIQTPKNLYSKTNKKTEWRKVELIKNSNEDELVFDKRKKTSKQKNIIIQLGVKIITQLCVEYKLNDIVSTLNERYKYFVNKIYMTVYDNVGTHKEHGVTAVFFIYTFLNTNKKYTCFYNVTIEMIVKKLNTFGKYNTKIKAYRKYYNNAESTLVYFDLLKENKIIYEFESGLNKGGLILNLPTKVIKLSKELCEKTSFNVWLGGKAIHTLVPFILYHIVYTCKKTKTCYKSDFNLKRGGSEHLSWNKFKIKYRRDSGDIIARELNNIYNIKVKEYKDCDKKIKLKCPYCSKVS